MVITLLQNVGEFGTKIKLVVPSEGGKQFQNDHCIMGGANGSQRGPTEERTLLVPSPLLSPFRTVTYLVSLFELPFAQREFN